MQARAGGAKGTRTGHAHKASAWSAPVGDRAIPANHDELLHAAERSRRLLRRRALASSAAAALPIPGLDLLIDVTVLSKLFTEINAEFGLTPEQIARLTPHRQEMAYKAIMAVGSAMIGKVVTRELVLAVLRRVGVSITTRQAARYLPVVGQAASALLSFTALKYVGEQHVRNCVQVGEVLLGLPAPSTSTLG